MMLRRVLLPVVALALAAGAALLAQGVGRSAPEAVVAAAAPVAEALPGLQVLVAAEDLPIGSFVQPGTLIWQDWPDVTLPDAYWVQGEIEVTDLVGAVVRTSVTIGQPITERLLVKPGERGFLAAVLEPGMRAISVRIDQTSSNAGLILPGDRVDVILTQKIDGATPEERTRRASETVLDDVKIIAMGHNLDSDAGVASPGFDAETATLEVTPSEAERIALVAELGRLSLSLRSIASSEDPRPGGVTTTWDSDVSRAIRGLPSASVVIVRGKDLEVAETNGLAALLGAQE